MTRTKRNIPTYRPGHSSMTKDYLNPAPVFKVYRNLHKNCFSIKRRGLVVGHAEALYMENVTFVVSEAGRQRVLRTKRKTVHATVNADNFTVRPKADPFPTHGVASDKVWTEIHYNPYKCDGFYAKSKDGSTKQRVQGAGECVLYMYEDKQTGDVRAAMFVRSPVWG